MSYLPRYGSAATSSPTTSIGSARSRSGGSSDSALPESSLRTSHVNVYSKYSKKKRTNKLPYGTCTVTVHNSRIVQTIYGSIQEYGGFDRPEWLD